MKEHILMECAGYEGLYKCTVCESAEGEIPTDCPNRKMTQKEKEDVFKGRLNFRDGKWIKLVERPWMVSLDDSFEVTETIIDHSCRHQPCDCGPELICRAETKELAKQIVEEHNNAIPRNDKHTKG